MNGWVIFNLCLVAKSLIELAKATTDNQVFIAGIGIVVSALVAGFFYDRK